MHSSPGWGPTPNNKAFDGVATLRIGTLLILTTVCAWVLLLAVGAVQALLFALIKREWLKLDGAAELQKKYASIAGDLAVLRKSHEALDELVLTKMNRIATTAKREKKKADSEASEEAEFQWPADVEFPSRMK